jgi:hypothetical protein
MLCQSHAFNTCLAHDLSACTPFLRVPDRPVLAPSHLCSPCRPVGRGPLRRAGRLLLVRATGAPGVIRGRPPCAEQPAVHVRRRRAREAEVVVMTPQYVQRDPRPRYAARRRMSKRAWSMGEANRRSTRQGRCTRLFQRPTRSRDAARRVALTLGQLSSSMVA